MVYRPLWGMNNVDWSLDQKEQNVLFWSTGVQAAVPATDSVVERIAELTWTLIERELIIQLCQEGKIQPITNSIGC
jgi:hypothetical protein